MSKKVFYFCLAFMAMLFLPATLKAEVKVAFKFMHQNESVQGLDYYDTRVQIYYSGAYIGEARCNDYDYQTGERISGTASVTLGDSYVGKKLAYISSMGHCGEFILDGNGNSLELQCTKLTVTAKDDEGNPMKNKTISLKVQGSNAGGYTNSEGQAVIYTAPGDYDWSWDYGSGSIDLTTDQTLELTAKVEKIEVVEKYNIKFVPRYANFPAFAFMSSISSPYSLRFYLYQDGARKGSEYYEQNYIRSFTATAGTYQIRDDWGGTSGDIEIKSDTTIYLDYHKVTFTSMSGTTPNAGQEISVQLKENNSSSSNRFSSISATTNSKGVAELYLLPGEYAYTAAGETTYLVVEDKDMSVNIETVLVTFNINCDDISATNFYINGSKMVPSTDGKLTYGCLPGAEVTFAVSKSSYYYSDEASSMTLTADESKTVNVDVYSLIFKTNDIDGSTPSLYSNTSSYSRSVNWNNKIYLLPGTYKYSISGQTETVTLDKNTVIEKNFATVTVNVKDTDGKPVNDIYVSCNNGYSSNRTNQNGDAILHLLLGEQTLTVGSYESRNIVVTGDATESYVIPGIITFTVITDKNYISIYNDDNSNASSISYEKVGDQVTARIDPTKEYRFSGYQGKTKITEGCTITLGTLSVTSEGNGLAFPMENWDAVSTYNVIVGSPVRLSAIPVGNDTFLKWTINNKDYTDAMIDFKTTSRNTVATAVFSGNASALSGPVRTNSRLDFNESYITLPDDMEGTARIFTLDGKQVKQMGVVGDQIGIYDLPTGAYILSFQHDNGVINARFAKK